MSKQEKKAYKQGIKDTLLLLGITVFYTVMFVYGIMM